MSQTPEPRRGVRWRWAVAIVILIAVDVLVLFGIQRGERIDYIAESAATSSCTTGPAPEAWFAVVVSLFPIAYCTRRLARSDHR